MKKPDDSDLTPEQYSKVRREAERALAKADALGCFPTPVAEIMAAAEVEEAPDDVLDLGFLTRMRKKAGATLKQALSKVIGLFDAKARLIFIDRSLHAKRKIFIRLHETAHAFLGWQRDLYAVVEDCERTLAPELAELFDREANVFASEVLFQLDGFIEEASSYKFGLNIPLELAEKYGASIHASIRQYVSQNPRACAVLILEPPKVIPRNGFKADLRRVVVSPCFTEKFGELNCPDCFTPDDEIGAMIPINGNSTSGPREITLKNSDGEQYRCIAEAFFNQYNVFILIHSLHTLTRTTIIPPNWQGPQSTLLNPKREDQFRQHRDFHGF